MGTISRLLRFSNTIELVYTVLAVVMMASRGMKNMASDISIIATVTGKLRGFARSSLSTS